MGIIERPRSLNPHKVIAMAIYPIIAHFTTQRARWMHDVSVNAQNITPNEIEQIFHRAQSNEIGI